MQRLKLDRFDTLNSLLNEKILEGEKILYRFEVVPLDYRVVDFSTPELVLTNQRLIFIYDQTLELYDFDELELEMLGGEPKFTFLQQLTERIFYYTVENQAQIKEIHAQDGWIRMSITPENAVPKDFVLREGQQIAKSYKTWAVYRMIKNIIESGTEAEKANEKLKDIVAGNFSYFNRRIMLLFIMVFVVYVIIRIISITFLPDIVSEIILYLFMAGSIGMLGWVIYTQERNNKRFLSIYDSYRK